MFKRAITTALGAFTLTASEDALLALDWGSKGDDDPSPLLDEASRQVKAYAQGDLRVFDLPLAPEGGPFQQAVLTEMLKIPWGETTTYGAIAKTLDAPPQPIGQACGANTIPIIIPCHRVTGATGLGGFSGADGVESKIALLRHEGAYGLLI